MAVGSTSAWGQQASMARSGGERDNGAGGPRTDLYFASLPNNWDENEIKAFHQDIGSDAQDIVLCKLLPRRQGLNSRAAIVRYISHAAASRALQLCRSNAGNMEVRFAEEKKQSEAPQGGGYGAKGGGKSWGPGAGGGGSRKEDSAVPVSVGLRVRNQGNGQTGHVVACRGRTPGTFRVLFDNGQEWEWEVKRFETEDGWPLLDVEAVPATINMRVRCWMDGRTGRIAYIHNDWPQRIWVEFDDGDAGEKDATWFVSEDQLIPVGPGLTNKEWRHQASKGGGGKGGGEEDYYASWEYQQWPQQGSKGGGNFQKGGGGKPARQDYGWAQGWDESSYRKGGARDWQESGRGGAARGKDNSWWDSSEDYSGKGGSKSKSYGEDRYNKSSERKPAAAGGESKGKSKGGKASSDLEEAALREVIDQLLDESNAGRVWINNWPGRFQSKLGQLREFLESHPDKFTVIQQNGRRYTVAFAGGAPPAAATKEKKEKPEKKTGGAKWMKKSNDGDAAGGGASAAKEEAKEDSQTKGPRSALRTNADGDEEATAFDVENEDSDDPVEDAMRSREKDDKEAEEKTEG